MDIDLTDVLLRGGKKPRCRHSVQPYKAGRVWMTLLKSGTPGAGGGAWACSTDCADQCPAPPPQWASLWLLELSEHKLPSWGDTGLQHLVKDARELRQHPETLLTEDGTADGENSPREHTSRSPGPLCRRGPQGLAQKQWALCRGAAPCFYLAVPSSQLASTWPLLQTPEEHTLPGHSCLLPSEHHRSPGAQ